jgi:hypothetical protein
VACAKIVVFWVMTAYSIVGEYNILEEHAASTFRPVL